MSVIKLEIPVGGSADNGVPNTGPSDLARLAIAAERIADALRTAEPPTGGEKLADVLDSLVGHAGRIADAIGDGSTGTPTLREQTHAGIEVATQIRDGIGQLTLKLDLILAALAPQQEPPP